MIWPGRLEHDAADVQPGQPSDQAAISGAVVAEAAGGPVRQPMHIEMIFPAAQCPSGRDVDADGKLKAILRKAAARTRGSLWDAVATALDAFSPEECANYSTAAGHQPE